MQGQELTTHQNYVRAMYQKINAIPAQFYE